MSDRVPVYILSGGRSSRFGSDKARAMLHGEPLIVHVAESVEPYASRITVVAERAERYDDLGLTTIGDLEPGGGPVAGLVTAMRDCDEPWLLLTSCDFVGIRGPWIEMLLAHRTPHEKAVAYRGDRWEPMLSVWRATAIDVLERELRAGRSSMQEMLDEVMARDLPPPDDWPQQPGVNTREDLERLT